MKKLILTALVATVVATPAFAGHHEGKHKDKRAHMEKVDTNKDGKISKEEFLAEKSKHFEKMDENKDGFLDRDDMKAAREKFKKHREKYDKKHGMKKGDCKKDNKPKNLFELDD